MDKKQRSVFPGDDIKVCYRCGLMCKSYENFEEHHVFGGSSRQVSDKYGLFIHVCRDCHNFIHSKEGKECREHLHKVGQEIYEERFGSREKFIEEFIRSYL